MKKTFIFLFLIVLASILMRVFFVTKEEKVEVEERRKEVVFEEIKKEEIIYPTINFLERITKKSFGDYITPITSPVQPERFSGWHTGVDIEFSDVEDEVTVIAVCDGKINYSGWVSGYGGIAVLECQISEDKYYLVYGHLDIESITNKVELTKGEMIGILGKGFTQKTDFERKHLHFGVHKNSMNLRGYIENEGQLNDWINPVVFTQLLNH